MTTKSKTTRRAFFASMASLLGAGGGVLLFALGTRRKEALIPELPRVLSDISSAEMIGNWYLTKVPEEADMDVLTRLIFSGLGWHVFLLSDIDVVMRRKVKRDFAEDRVVRAGGWFLSETETRLCALTVLARRR